MSSQIEVQRNRSKGQEMSESGLWHGSEGAVIQLKGAERGERRNGIQVYRIRGQVKLLDKRREKKGLQRCTTVRFGSSPVGTEVNPAFLQSAEMFGHLAEKVK